MAQSEEGLTNAEHGALAWIAVKERFQKTDNGCKCASCHMIRLMIAVEEQRLLQTGTEAERRLRSGRN